MQGLAGGDCALQETILAFTSQTWKRGLSLGYCLGFKVSEHGVKPDAEEVLPGSPLAPGVPTSGHAGCA